MLTNTIYSEDKMPYAICLGLFAPLAGFFALMLSAKYVQRQAAGLIACSTILFSLLCFIGLLIADELTGISATNLTLYHWISIGQIKADATLHLDSLTFLMTFIITGVGFLIHVYSIGYMDDERDFARYFACLNFFVFAMLLLVLAGDLLVLFVGWEGVGLASYLLIGFWYQRPAAAQAATKAFVVNRIGDLGLLLGLLLTFHLFGTTNIAEITSRAGQEWSNGGVIITVLTLLYFAGAVGKSAQLPLHVWLPDAMEGPTPVSALIHAATMVTAGVYLIVRMHFLFLLAPLTLQVVGVIGAVTSLFASLCAVGQTDLKRVLAYSTVSQLGLMFLACGAGAFYSAMFHLTTHAFMKSLLFLSAGNVVHMMHGTTEMAKMGGLAKVFPKTHWFFLIGCLAMAGIPPFAAFFSKDLILEIEYLEGFKILFYVGLAASILTGFYLTRAYCLTFTGPAHHSEGITEAPPVMTRPVAILAFLSIVGGFLGFAFGKTPPLENFLVELGINPAEKLLSHGLMFDKETWMAIGGAFFGVGVAALVYTVYVQHLGSPIALFRKSFFVDEIYEKCIVLPLKGMASLAAKFFEPQVFDGGIRVASRTTEKIAWGFQQSQSGQIRSYVAWTVLGMVALIVYLAL
jgi:NADH-quinone oxidoreductase subunit L